MISNVSKVLNHWLTESVVFLVDCCCMLNFIVTIIQNCIMLQVIALYKFTTA